MKFKYILKKIKNEIVAIFGIDFCLQSKMWVGGVSAGGLDGEGMDRGCTPPETATEAGGTHPTGIYSCYSIFAHFHGGAKFRTQHQRL